MSNERITTEAEAVHAEGTGNRPEPIVSEPTVIEMDPARLAHGQWCHRRNKMLGRGDVSASYSADRIAENKPIRKPFDWRGEAWVSTGGQGLAWKAYRLIDRQVFGETATTYGERVRGGDASRADPNGFHHGVTVTRANRSLVLCGAPVVLVPGRSEQLELF